MHHRSNTTRLISRVGIAAAIAIGVASWATVPARADAAANTTTSFSYVSQPGDYIGQGQSQSFNANDPGTVMHVTAPYGAVPTLKDGIMLSLNTTGYTDWWTAEITPARGQSLHVGTFGNIQRSAFRTGTHPGLDVYGDGRGCNNDFGSFTVNSLRANSSGTITEADVTFVQHCEGISAPPLRGEVKFNVPPVTEYSYTSDPGDYIGQGISQTFTPTNASITLGAAYAGNATPTVNGFEMAVNGNAGDWWYVVVEPVAGQTLHVGTFPGAQRAAFRTAGHPGLDVFGDGRGCNTLKGSFTINSLQADSAGKILSVSMTFNQHCEGAAPALEGTVQYNA